MTTSSSTYSFNQCSSKNGFYCIISTLFNTLPAPLHAVSGTESLIYVLSPFYMYLRCSLNVCHLTCVLGNIIVGT